MSLGKRWPSTAAFLNWVYEKGDGFRNGEYGKMQNGKSVSTRLVVRFVEFLAQRASEGRETEAVQAVLEFLQTIGINEFSQHSEPRIAKCLLAPDDDDYLGRDVDGLIDVIVARPKCERFVNACLKEADVKDAIRWMFVEVGRQINDGKQVLTCDQAIDAARHQMQIKLKDYQELAITWWKFDPWTVMLARGDRVSKTGMSIVLPLRHAAYDTLRDGSKWGYSLTPADLERPSRTLWLEGAASRPKDLGGEEGNTTRHTQLAVVCQMGILSYCLDHRREIPRRALTFGGTPHTERNLRNARFKRTGTRMGDSDIHMFERVMTGSGRDTLWGWVFDGIGAQSDRWLTPPGNMGPKKRR
jgi:hypothetical protein